MTKIDWSRGKHQVSGRYFYSKFNQVPDTSGLTQNLLAIDGSGNHVRVQTLSLNDVYSKSPTLLFNTWFGWNSQVGGSLSGDLTGADAITLTKAGVNIADGAPGMPPALDGLNVSGFFVSQGGHFGDFNRGDWRIREVVTAEKGPHELIFGGEVIRILQDVSNTNTQTGNFAFTGQYSGSNLVDFLLGAPTTFTQGAGQYQNVRATVPSLFVQDNWRVGKRLVLNLGVRWDPWWPFAEIVNRVPCWAPGQKSARYPNAPVGLIYGGDPGCLANTAYGARLAYFGPRLGFAYRISETTVIRGGAGIFYSLQPSDNINGTVTTAPFNPRYILTRPSFVDPYGSLGIVNPFPRPIPLGTVPGPNAQFTLPIGITNILSPDTQNSALGMWNLKLEHQLRANWLLSAAYVGNGGWDIQGTVEANPAIYIPGASTTANTQARRAVQGITTVSQAQTVFNSHYHSLQVNMDRRFSRGLSLIANYVWSKKIDNAGDVDPFNRNFNHGLASDDIPHVFHLSPVWLIPTPQLQGFAGKALKGWELASITTWRSGTPFSVSSGVDNSLSGVGADRADFIGTDLGQARLSGQSHAQEIQQFFKTSLFVRNAIGTYGNSGKDILLGPRSFNTDLSLIKDTTIAERAKVQFRAEFFNLFDNVNFSNPGGTLGNPNLGRITSAGDPRILQLALKFMF